MPTFTQTAFSQPAVNYQHDQPNQSIFSQPAVHFQQTQPTQTNQTNQTGQQYPNNVQSQQFQQFQTATISANNAKFPYLEKEKYEIWAMKMEYWIRMLIIIFVDCFDTSMMLYKGRIIKARFGGNEESKKMRKTMLKQQFTEFSVTEEEGLHKGYDRFQKILSQLNQVQARPDNDDINLKFLRALPSSCYGVKVATAPTQSASLELPQLWLKAFTYSDQQRKEQTKDELQQYATCQNLTKGRLDLLQMTSMGHFARECNVKTVEIRARLVRLVEKVYGMMAGLHADSADVSEAAAEFAMMGISPKAYQNAVKTLESQKDWYHKTQIALEEKIRILSANLENTTNTLSYTEKLHDQAQKEKKEWEVKFEATLARFEKWKESSKNLKKLINSSMSTRTKIGLGFKEYFGKDEVFDLSTPSVMYPEPVEEEVKPLYSWFVKAGEMHAVPPSITGTYMPIPYKSDIEETQVSYGSKSDNKTSETLSESNDFVSCDNSDKSSDSETYASCDSSLKTKTKDFPPAVDIKTLLESDVEDPNSTTGSPSFSCLENVKSPRIFCNKSGMNNRNVCKNNSVRVKKCFVCGSKLHLIKDCNFYNCVDSVPCKSKAAYVPVGSRNSSASVTAGGSAPAASRNRPAENSAGRPNPTGRVGQAAHLAAAQSNPVGWSKRPAPVSAGRPVSAGWLNPAARPYFRPSSVYFNNMYWPELYDPMYMNEGRWGTAGDPSTDNDIGIVDSGCSRSMSGNKEKLDDFAFDGPRFEYLVVKYWDGGYGVLLVAAGIVYAVNTSIYAAELVLWGGAQFDIAGWLVSATSHLVSAGSLQSCWYNNVSAE
ncbi:hypothetical protein Tco_1029175 [Tanacetum coccineum]|uniref:CCHC-type domain-containing protein n=1 Tax=Tanacetum coccineum TaxID=301880 RepID=A0ABQ5G496_9ASTR